MGFASFWHGAGPSVPFDERAFDRVFDLRQLAADTLRVEDHDRALMRPKLLARSRATQPRASAEASFEARAVAAQIGWLETSLPSVAADAIVNIERLLSIGFNERDGRASHQLRVFEAYQAGLLATWEAPDALICVPRLAGL